MVDGAFNYGELLQDAQALIKEFGLEVTFLRDQATGDKFSRKKGTTLFYKGFVIKTRKSRAVDIQTANVTDTQQAKFLISSDTEVQIGDTFTFHQTKYIVDTITLINPGGLVIYQEATVK